jgi:drug/metabolite transporter (DMT)-like permease
MTPPNEDPLRGIALTIGATVLFATSDTISKYLSITLPVVEILWIRYVIFVVMAAYLAWHANPRALLVRSPGMQAVRGLCLVGSSILFVFGVRQMPMAEAAAISFIAPLLITVLSIPLLGEVVGIRRWIAVTVGMVGMLIIVRPGTSAFQPAAFFGVASSLCWSMALIITRKMATTERPTTTLLWSSVVGAMVLSALLPLNFIWPTSAEFALAFVLGVLASIGQWMVVLAHRQAPASLLAPFTYVQLLWSTLGGYLVFAALPDHWTLVGAAIIIASGLYTAHRERVRQRVRN